MLKVNILKSLSLKYFQTRALNELVVLAAPRTVLIFGKPWENTKRLEGLNGNTWKFGPVCQNPFLPFHDFAPLDNKDAHVGIALGFLQDISHRDMQ